MKPDGGRRRRAETDKSCLHVAALQNDKYVCVKAVRIQGAGERHELRGRDIGDWKRGRRVLLRARGTEKKTKKNETESRHHA